MNTYNIHHVSHKINQNKVSHENINKKNNNSFQKILDNTKNIKFSKHAVKRMDDRDISMSNEEVLKINDAIDKAKDKGLEDALILINNKAFIASVRNRTVVTTFSSEQLKNNVFTNIDGAVII